MLSMNNSVCLFTNEFPYGLQEAFIENEIEVLCEKFDRVIIVPVFKNTTIREFPLKNLEIMTPVNNSRDITVFKLVLLLYPVFWKTFFEGMREVGFSYAKFIKSVKQAFIVARLKKYIEKRPEVMDVDLWYFYWGTNACSVLPFLNKHPKSITRYHRYDLYDEDIDGGGAQVFQRKVLEKVNRAFFVSDDGRKYLEKKFSDLRDKLEVSRLGVPDRGMSRPSEDKVLRIVTCSNIYKVKRVDLFARALSKIRDIPIHWTHFGDGPQDMKIKLFKQVSKFGGNINFTFMGRRKNSEVMEYFSSSAVDLFVNVSESEGLPVSIMEALSFGIPVIATDVGGSGELINGKNGWLINKDINADKLSRLIIEYHKMGLNNIAFRESARESWANLVDSELNYQSFVTKLLEI